MEDSDQEGWNVLLANPPLGLTISDGSALSPSGIFLPTGLDSPPVLNLRRRLHLTSRT